MTGTNIPMRDEEPPWSPGEMAIIVIAIGSIISIVLHNVLKCL